jgi:hypothetical protein
MSRAAITGCRSAIRDHLVDVHHLCRRGLQSTLEVTSLQKPQPHTLSFACEVSPHSLAGEFTEPTRTATA